MLIRYVADARTLGRIYVAVVQALLIYGLYVWVIAPLIGMLMVGFHHKVAHNLKV